MTSLRRSRTAPARNFVRLQCMLSQDRPTPTSLRVQILRLRSFAPISTSPCCGTRPWDQRTWTRDSTALNCRASSWCCDAVY